MIAYYEEQNEEEKERLTEAVKTLFQQTYILERKYDRKTGRMQVNQQFRTCDLHLEFLKAYFAIADLEVREDVRDGIIYLYGGENQIGPKLSEYATKFLLILKVTFDEQMASASTSSHVITSRAEVQEKMAGFHLLTRQPTALDVRTTIRLLKKYQLIEFLENGDDNDLAARFLVYPTIHMVLLGEDIRQLLAQYGTQEGENDDAEV